MKDKDREKQAEHIAKVVPAIAKFIEDKAKEYFETKSERMNFTLSCCVNLLGNLAMQLSPDDIHSKLHVTANTVDNLMEWYKVSMTQYRIQKEAH